VRETIFDAAYYRRYYETPRTTVVTRAEAKAEVAFVLAFCRHIDLEIRRFADVGAGTGWWAREFKRQYRKRCETETFDSSPAAADRYGHTLVAADKFGGRPYDLIVCRDVLRYMSDRTAAKAIEHIAQKCRGVLYLHVVTRDDEIAEAASDMTGYFRPVSWYTRRLDRGFINAGMGLFVSRKFRAFDPFAIQVP
jgi:SAM-dependent methyltransferase